MKKDRNMMMSNPYMQNMPYGMPMNMAYIPNPNMPNPNMPNQNMNAFGNIENNLETTIQNMQGQINMLDKRVSKLENMVMAKDNYTNVNNTNYHIM